MWGDEASMSGQPFVWRGVLDSELQHNHVVVGSHRFADAAKAGDWSAVLSTLDDPTLLIDINGWRPGGTAWFTVLHQAAWHGAPANVVAGLIRRGALLTLTESRGRTAHDVFMDRSRKIHWGKGVGVAEQSRTLLEQQLMSPPSPLSSDEIHSLDGHLAQVIDGRIGVLFDGRNPREVLRYPPVEILHEVPDQHVWFPVPGMYGGFDIRLQENFLDVKSWCRAVGGSGQEHVITTAGAILVDEGFV
ncbi:MAG: ankyrin repeat domain-containing protein [Mycobacteriaceae bacterium]|nr:ankyrin repeat domain-containing protein [Mycobacteriaceae bacterium]